MNTYISGFSSQINSFFDFRVALGYSDKTYAENLKLFDRYCAAAYPAESLLTEEIVLGWLEDRCADIYRKAMSMRAFGKYLRAIGQNAYILPEKYVTAKQDFSPYIFSDEELSRLFSSIDRIKASKSEPFMDELAPVLYRLIYTCGLRPREGRELKTENINLKTGEILIVQTKRKKDRLVVMSNDMRKLASSYNEKRKIFGKSNEYFFPSWNGGALASRRIDYYLKNAWKAANPDCEKVPNVRTYDLRHRFASAALMRWIDRGDPLPAKLPYLRAYMGHESLSETMQYIHILPENLVRTSGIDWSAFDEIIPEVAEWEK